MENDNILAKGTKKWVNQLSKTGFSYYVVFFYIKNNFFLFQKITQASYNISFLGMTIN